MPVTKTTVEVNKFLVLIVDDELDVRQLLRLFLEESGYRIAEAKNGIEAINVFHQQRPDLVLLDALMPDMDGFEFCKKLKLVDGNNYTPVLMITVLEDQHSIKCAFEAGVMDYVIKPFHLPLLRQRIRRLIEQSQQQQQLVAVNQQLQRLVNVDGLTQVANRRWFEEYLALEWQRQARSNSRTLSSSAMLISSNPTTILMVISWAIAV